MEKHLIQSHFNKIRYLPAFLCLAFLTASAQLLGILSITDYSLYVFSACFTCLPEHQPAYLDLLLAEFEEIGEVPQKFLEAAEEGLVQVIETSHLFY